MDDKTRDNIRAGFYSAEYFNKAKSICEKRSADVTMQVFCRTPNVYIYGISEVLEIFRECAGAYTPEGKWIQDDNLQIVYTEDGSYNGPVDNRVVMKITGKYSSFAHLESVYLGILARSSKIYSNVKSLKSEMAAGQKLYFFADRFDRFENQVADGECALAAGVDHVTTAAMASSRVMHATGSMPHALIAVHYGNVVVAVKKLIDHDDKKVVALVDYNNDCVSDVKAVINALKDAGKLDRLWGFRLDTSGSLVDLSLAEEAKLKILQGHEVRVSDIKGVNRFLVKKVKDVIDAEAPGLQIMVSGGITPDRIRTMPNFVDAYGVGSYIVNNNPVQFTADIVRVNGSSQYKAGRCERDLHPGMKFA